MDTFTLKLNESKYSNQEIYLSIKTLIASEEVIYNSAFTKLLLITDLIEHITDKNLLNNTYELLELIPYINNHTEQLEALANLFPTEEFTESEITKVISVNLSILLKYDIFKECSKLISLEIEPLELILEPNFIIYTNINDIERKLKKKYFINKINGIENLENSVSIISNLIKSFSEKQYLEGYDFDEEIDFLYNLSKASKSKSSRTNTEFKAKINSGYSYHFSNNGEVLFDYIFYNYIINGPTRGISARLSFFYWKMYLGQNSNKYITSKSSEFLKWVNDKYGLSVKRIRNLDVVTDNDNNRERQYSDALDWFKANYQ